MLKRSITFAILTLCFIVLPACSDNIDDISVDVGTFNVNEGIGGFASGGYKENSIHPTAVGWTRQSRFKGPDNPEIKKEIELPSILKSYQTEPIVDEEGNFYIRINGRDNDNLFTNIGENDGFVKLDRKGNVLWKNVEYHSEYDISAGNNENPAPVLTNDNQLIGTLDHKTLASLDVETGEFNFVYQIEDDLSLHPWSPAVGEDGTIYFAYNDNLVALNSDGTEKWVYVADEDDEMGGIDYTPVVTQDRIYVRDWDAISAFNLNGDLLWSESMGHLTKHDQSNILVDDEQKIYFAHKDRLISYNKDGELLWDVVVEDSDDYISGFEGLALSKDGLIIGQFLPYLYAFDLDGNEVWRSEWFHELGGVTVDSEGTSYFAGASTLYSVDNQGQTKWTLEMPSAGYPGDVVIGPNEEIYLTIDSSSEASLLIIGNK